MKDKVIAGYDPHKKVQTEATNEIFERIWN